MAMVSFLNQTVSMELSDDVASLPKKIDIALEEDMESTDTGDEFDADADNRSSAASEDWETSEQYKSLESMGLLMFRPRILVPVHEFMEDEFEQTPMRPVRKCDGLPVKISASASLSRGRKDKTRVGEDPLKKRPLYAHDCALLHNELKPVRMTINDFLLEDSFGDFLRNVIS
jgi:hypothetical protein